MIKIGITGGIGSGKSTVCKVFELLGIPVYSADDESKKMLDEDVRLKEAIVAVFGNEILNEEKFIDRKKLAALVFNNKSNLDKLNAIIHPAVGKHFDDWAEQHQQYPYIIKEAAILFESGAYKQVDQVIAVVADKELKVKRAMQRDKISREQVEQRINNQMPEEEIVKRSQFVIHNDEEELLIPQVLKIHEQLKGN
jgi:dephospho-CoA kinase